MADVTRTVAVDVDEREPSSPGGFSWPWYVVTLVGAVGVALAGWVLLAGVTTLGWTAATTVPFRDAVTLATKVFALAHAVPVDIGGQHVTLVPLGLTFLLVFLAVPVVGHAARKAAAGAGEVDPSGEVRVDRDRVVWTVAGLHAATYCLAVTATTGALLGGQAAARALLGGAVVGLVAGLWGAARGLGHDPTAPWPAWLRSVPRALAVAVLTVWIGGSAVVAVAVFQGRGRVGELTTNLGVDGAGIVALAVLHLIYLPNLVLWASSWLLGAGITLGDGSLVSLLVTDVGLLPGVPVLGAVPEPGTNPTATLWWLAVGAAAGAVAGLVVVWARPRARFDETALVGGLSGVLAGLVLTFLGVLATGGLGVARLAHVGARTGELAIFAPVLLGTSGMLAGLVLGLVRRLATPEAATQAADDNDQGAPGGAEEEQ
ncbi:DUF6350 family protein [uncultured Tessaracoccus sp.]|uniref:cell division protein PerM n=1 Tax=uncultured Tessaracoccus sp. TaxID=905023 RepID=UPI0025F98E10|nr:DUF6350 family protein [uncultured Tessaracoccus sp.]